MKKYLKAYINNRPLFYAFLRPKELKLFHDQMPFKKPILDFGCGDGFFAKVLFGKEKIDAGIDIDEKVLTDAHNSGIYKKVCLYDGKKLPFKDGTFSTVISNCVMEHVDGLSRVLKELNRVTKKGAKFYLSVMTNKWNEHLLGGKIFGKRYLDWMRKVQKHKNLLSLDDWESEFKKAGFKIIEKEGYVDKSTSRLIEVFHYLSVDSLISHKLFHRWIIFPFIRKYFRNYLLVYLLKRQSENVTSSAVFFELENTG